MNNAFLCGLLLIAGTAFGVRKAKPVAGDLELSRV